MLVLKKTWLKQGIFAVNKPLSWTSNDVVRFLKSFLAVKKIGHGGTLDPLASGILVIGINEHTKELANFLKGKKAYRATIILNQQTTTGDLSGKITNQKKITFSFQQVIRVINKFYNHTYYQKPHPYSAIKVGGKKLYQYARANQQVMINPRLVTIQSISLVDFHHPYLTIDLVVSKGFYVRSFAEDFAFELKTYGCLSQLIRTSCGKFSLNQSIIDIAKLKQTILANKPIK